MRREGGHEKIKGFWIQAIMASVSLNLLAGAEES
jgi:hypothetical protein